ncbi:helix-turn-helix transcriptional regulator [Photobacterium profundum]|uniref:helix-turn-helix transcriptional regulator n=1 Tax=Photobacterium profundum TaxID=74109 RepID=UPI003D0AF881
MKLLISEKIKTARTSRDITQVDMAKKLKLSRQTYLNLETGKTSPRCDMLLDIANVTGYEIGFFYTREEGKEHPDCYTNQQVIAIIREAAIYAERKLTNV